MTRRHGALVDVRGAGRGERAATRTTCARELARGGGGAGFDEPVVRLGVLRGEEVDVQAGGPQLAAWFVDAAGVRRGGERGVADTGARGATSRWLRAVTS